MKDADNNYIRIQGIYTDCPGLTETFALPRKDYHNFCTARREEVSACFIITEHVRFCKPKYILCPISLTAECVSQASSVEQMLTCDVIIWKQGTYRHRTAEPKKIRVKRLRTRQD